MSFSVAAVVLASRKYDELTRPLTIAQFNRSIGHGVWMKLTAHRLYGLLAELTSKFLFLALGSNTSQPVTAAKATPI